MCPHLDYVSSLGDLILTLTLISSLNPENSPETCKDQLKCPYKTEMTSRQLDTQGLKEKTHAHTYTLSFNGYARAPLRNKDQLFAELEQSQNKVPKCTVYPIQLPNNVYIEAQAVNKRFPIINSSLTFFSACSDVKTSEENHLNPSVLLQHFLISVKTLYLTHVTHPHN